MQQNTVPVAAADLSQLQRLVDAEKSGAPANLYVDDLVRLSRAGYVRLDHDGVPHVTSRGWESLTTGRQRH